MMTSRCRDTGRVGNESEAMTSECDRKRRSQKDKTARGGERENAGAIA